MSSEVSIHEGEFYRRVRVITWQDLKLPPSHEMSSTFAPVSSSVELRSVSRPAYSEIFDSGFIF